jgi:alpha-galactosidase
MRLLATSVILALGLSAGGLYAAEEMRQKDEWANAHLFGPQAKMPFSFVYDGQASDKLLGDWPKKAESKQLDANRTQHTCTWTDPKTALEVRCVAVDYADFPAIEWTAYFKNTGKEATPILENIQGIDARWERGQQGEFVLHHWKGDTSRPDLYQPLELALGPGAEQRFAAVGGRGSNGAFPYYNLVMPGGGVMLAVGWPGQWAASFSRDAERGLRIAAGQELTHLALKPGEQVRAPLAALVFWQGDDTVRAQNLWRRWMWAHNVPRTADGKLPPPILFGNTSLEFNEMLGANEENQKYFIDRYIEERVAIDYWWMDAGWYPCGGRWPNTGTWEPDLERFPRGLRAISDHARSKGVKTLVWFEPERVGDRNSWLGKNHPEWLVGNLLNLGNPEALKWLTDHVDRTLREQAISLYRQDFNTDPLGNWRKSDAPDRQGIAENLHVQGYLAYWDALRQRHPQLIIDSCASGGRRNDLETMRRAVALHPTDFNYSNLAVKQAFHASLFQWIPYFGSNTIPVDQVGPYAFRSGHGMAVVLGYDLRRKDLDCGQLRKLAAEWRQIVPSYHGDYYPLTPYSIAADQWIAWQFDRPEQGDGVIEAFRRDKCEEGTKTFRLRGLDPAAQYELTNFDVEGTTRVSGKELMDKGLTVAIKDQPGAAVIAYRMVGRQTGTRPMDIGEKAGTFASRIKETPPFSFNYGDRPIRDLLPGWQRQDDGAGSVAWRDPSTGFSVALEFSEFESGQIVEWVVRLTNQGKVPSPLCFYTAKPPSSKRVSARTESEKKQEK